MTAHPILAVNMRRQNFAMHVLLATNNMDDILCVQEPWFDRIGVARDDAWHDGVDVLGGAAHPNWDIHYPFFIAAQRAKVMMYTRQFDRNRQKQLIPWKVVVRNDLGRHPTLLIIDIHCGTQCLRVITFYNDVTDPSSLASLLTLDLDPLTPMLLVGDFNTHSPTWSPASLPCSPHAHTLETWAANQALDLLTPPATLTRRGSADKRPSTLDLMWANFAASHLTDIGPPSYDWNASLASDHVGVRTQWHPSGAPPLLVTHDPGLSIQSWMKRLWSYGTPASVAPCLPSGMRTASPRQA